MKRFLASLCFRWRKASPRTNDREEEFPLLPNFSTEKIANFEDGVGDPHDRRYHASGLEVTPSNTCCSVRTCSQASDPSFHQDGFSSAEIPVVRIIYERFRVNFSELPRSSKVPRNLYLHHVVYADGRIETSLEMGMASSIVVLEHDELEGKFE